MKKSRKKIISGALAVILITVMAITALNMTVLKETSYAAVGGIVGSNNELKGVWIPTVHNLAYPSKPGLSAEVLKREADKILDTSKDLGFNVLFFQVRPSGDAFYKSNIYPWSKLISGRQGVAPAGGFDPLSYFIDGAHARGMELHAWVNPYRITVNASDNNDLAANNPAVLHPELTVKHTDGKLYLNPGEPAARKMVIDGVAEIIQNYNVDGIHFDDYFYPGKDFPDKKAFSKYGGAYANISDFRRVNNDALVQDMQTMIKSKNPKVAFGISPFGIWANKSSSSFGSNTNGNEAYSLYYADTRKWVKEEYIDYIIPQIYWEIGHSLADYSTLATWWNDVVKGTNVKLYSGMAAYKTIGVGPESPWAYGKEITKQLAFNKTLSEVKGNAMYAYQSITANQDLYNVIKSGNATAAIPPQNVGVDAVLSQISVVVDEKPLTLVAYNIGGYNYFKLRDMAFAVNGTTKQFAVDWNQNTESINLFKGKAYTPVGGELNVNSGAQSAKGIPMTAQMFLDNNKTDIKAYTIDNNNYFKLRDFGETFNFATEWNNDTRTVTIDTNKPYSPN